MNTTNQFSDAMNLSIKALKKRRNYNAFVTNEAIEDYSLRSAAKSFRHWPCWLLANTALGGITFLALEAIGALLVLNNGFINSTLAILCVSIIIMVTGLPISYYASRYNVDIDLLTRGAGFGYFGSTVTSLVYASYTIIFFAIEAAIMAKALEVGLGIPLSAGYLVSSVVIIPLVFLRHHLHQQAATLHAANLDHPLRNALRVYPQHRLERSGILDRLQGTRRQGGRL